MYSSVPTWAVKLLSSTRIQLPEKLHKISHNRYNILSYYHYDYYETRCCHTYTHLLSTKSFFMVYTNVVVVNLTSHLKTMSKIHYIHPKFCLWPPAQNQCQIISLSLSKHAFFYITEKHIPYTSNAIVGNTAIRPAAPSPSLRNFRDYVTFQGKNTPQLFSHHTESMETWSTAAESASGSS